MDDNFPDGDDDVLVAVLIDEEDELVLDVSNSEAVIIELSRSSEELIFVESEILEIQESGEDLDSPAETDESVVVTTFQDRLQEKFKSQTRTKRQWAIIGALSIAVVLTLVILTLESPFYNVDKVTVKNTSSVALTEKESKKLESLTKNVKGQSMYRVDYSTAVKKIKELPSISDVSVSKKWPSTIIVEVSRRVPTAYIETDKGVVLVDAKGYAFEKTEKAPQGLPSLDGINEITFTEKVADDTFLHIMKDAPVEIKSQISHIKKEKSRYALELTDGIDVILGDGEQMKEKLAIVWSIINAKKRSELGYIDVSVPSLPISGSPQLKV